jgi:flagellin-like hook-associated protein FlgL
MALAVIERVFDAELAEQVMNYTEYQWHRQADADPFAQLLNQGVTPS